MKEFRITPDGVLKVRVTTLKRRGGFADEAQAFVDGVPVEKSRVLYTDKLTEQWQYKTALHKLADNTDMTLAERKAIVDYIVRHSK